jgi:hypothetical protein
LISQRKRGWGWRTNLNEEREHEILKHESELGFITFVTFFGNLIIVIEKALSLIFLAINKCLRTLL